MTRFQDWEGDAHVDAPKFGRSDSFEVAPDPFAIASSEPWVQGDKPEPAPALHVVPELPPELPKSITGDLLAAECALKYSQDEEWATAFDNEVRHLIEVFTEEYKKRRDAEFRQLERLQKRLRERTGIPELRPMGESFIFMETGRGERMTYREKADHILMIIKACGESGIKALELGRRVGEGPAKYVKLLPKGLLRREGERATMRYFYVGPA